MEFSIFNLLFVLLAAWVAGALVARIGYPAIFGELLVGIILGPPLLGLLSGGEALAVLAELGVLLMMLYIGMEIDASELFKASWGGFLAAIGGFITPFILAYLAVTLLFDGTVMAGLFVGIAAGVTSLATKSRILSDLKLLNTRIAHVMMAGALIADSLSLIVFAAIISLVDVGTLEGAQLAGVGLRALAFFAAAILIGLKGFPLIWNRLSKWGLTNRTFHATLLVVITLLFAEMAELAGLHAILGAFLAGLFIRDGIGLERKLAGELMEMVRDISIGFLAPIFFVMAGFQVSLDVFTTSLPLLLTVIIVATVGKIVGTAVFYLASGNGWREGLTIGTGMNGRGAVEIIIAEIALGAGIITQEIFSVLVFMAMFTTATVPLFLKWSTDWLRSRGELVFSHTRAGTIIVGAGPLARKLAEVLTASGPVWLIDKNRNDYTEAVRLGLNAIHDDALDPDVMNATDALTIDTMIALTTNSEVNLLAAQLAQERFRIPNVYVLTNDRETGVRQLVSESSSNQLFMTLTDLQNWDYWIANEGAREEVFEIDEPMSIKDGFRWLAEEQEALPLMVARNGTSTMYRNVESLAPGDKVIAIKRATELERLPEASLSA